MFSTNLIEMKSLLISGLLCVLNITAFSQSTPVFNDTSLLQPVEINAVRASDKTPVAKTTLSKKEIEKNNIGQDLPFILNQTPAVVVNSDAGNGIGYTGIRIRGADATRINVTINGIPYNDAESQGTFFVDLPDIASSASNIQVQRGVGTSTNGAGAFGGSININSNELITKRGFQFNSNAGSFSSFRNTLAFNSGLLARHFTADARLSNIRSDGYIERASSRLRSFYTSVAYADKKNSIRINVFSGKEKTYQAWNGVPESILATNRRYNSAGTEKTGDPYENETDNYTQTHYQLFYNRKINNAWKGNIAFFLTKGKGYYEQYKAAESLTDYGLPVYINGTDTVKTTDLIRRLWLDNNFYGSIFSLQYNKKKASIIIGGNINRYDGKHFGEIISAGQQKAVPSNYRWYNLTAKKTDVAGFIKWTQQLSANWQLFTDLQARSVNYNLFGFRNNPALTVKNNYFFINPKAGITYTQKNLQVFISYARGSKEPNRDDFETGTTQQPKAEYLNDIEAGFEYKHKKYSFAATIYYMKYYDQLVLTGKVNDEGAYTRTNIPNSFRTGIELQGAYRIAKWMSLYGNISFSDNRVKEFTEFLDDYDNGGQKSIEYKNTTIAFSPAVVSSAGINLVPIKNAEINLISKYVSRQYLDNTSNRFRTLKAYYLQDVRVNYDINLSSERSIKLFALASNIFSKKYEPNGYTFSYIYGGVVTTENYYLPMATFNITAGIAFKL